MPYPALEWALKSTLRFLFFPFGDILQALSQLRLGFVRLPAGAVPFLSVFLPVKFWLESVGLPAGAGSIPRVLGEGGVANWCWLDPVIFFACYVNSCAKFVSMMIRAADGGQGATVGQENEHKTLNAGENVSEGCAMQLPRQTNNSSLHRLQRTQQGRLPEEGLHLVEQPSQPVNS